MLFEGSEKKLEIILTPEAQSLRSQPDSFFQSLVKKSRAQILQSSSNAHATAYVLSESSLFIWDHRLILITCGKSTLVSSAMYLLNHLNIKNIQALFFQRKNEFFPLRQRTDFVSDVQKLNKRLKSRTYRFGNLDEHYFYLLHLDQSYHPKEDDQTVEILMYGLIGELADLFKRSNSTAQIREHLNLSECFPGFSIDDYIFEPSGYSLNALRGKEYFTIHVTPQTVGFYVSFETNMSEDAKDIIQKVILLLRPTSFDTIVTSPTQSFSSSRCNWEEYFMNNHYKKTLNCGFDVEFLSFKYKQEQAYLPHEFE